MSVIRKIIDCFISRPTIYVRLYKNEIEIKHLESDVLIKRKAITSFSNDRLFIADFLAFEFFFKSLIDELLNQKNKRVKKSLRILLQPIDDNIKKISPVEHRIYQDSMMYGGARQLYIYGKQRRLSNDEVLGFLAEKQDVIY